MHSVDASPATCSSSGECLTYDALGRMVEKTVANTYTQIVYGPQGRFATMNGQTTLVSAFIPLPGAPAVYTQASLSTSNKVAYYRHTDHLGSSRLATTPTQTLYSSTLLAFGAIIVLLTPDGSVPLTPSRLAASAALYAAALLTKETAVALLPVLLLIVLLRGGQRGKVVRAGYWYGFVTLGYFAIRWWALGRIGTEESKHSWREEFALERSLR